MYCDFKYEEKLTAALNLYEEKWAASLPDNSELESITFSKKFEDRIQKLFSQEKKEHKGGRILPFSTTFKRVTSLLLASVMFVVFALFGVTALRETLFGFFKEYSNDEATIIYPLDDPSYNPNIAFEETHFAYIPSGFEETTYNYTTHFYQKEYTNANGNYIKIHQEEIAGGVFILDTEGSDITKVDLFGSNAFYYEKNGKHLYWQYGSSYYLMVSDIPIEEMLKIARSLY